MSICPVTNSSNHRMSAGSLALNWRFLQLDAGDLHLMLNGNGYSRQFFDAQNTQRIAQPSYAIANGRLSFAGRQRIHARL